MSWVAVGVAGVSLIGGAIASDASGKAADAQMSAAERANDQQFRMYQIQRGDQTNWREAGSRAVLEMENEDFKKDFTMSDFQADPGYQFRLAEGQKAINAAASARGMANSGATMKSLAGYGQNLASQEYQNVYNRFNNDRTQRFNRLSSIAGLGQTSNGQMAGAAQNFANQSSQNMLAAGNAQAAGQIGHANAITGAIGQGMNTWMKYQQMNKANEQ